MCVRVKVKGLQDAVGFAVGALGEHEGVGASHAHFPSRQPQCPGHSSTAQRGDFDAVTAGRHDDDGKQRDRNEHEPHLRSCEEDRKRELEKKERDVWI